MKLKINGKYQNVDFWSFFKCSMLSYFAMGGILVLVGLTFGIIFG